MVNERVQKRLGDAISSVVDNRGKTPPICSDGKFELIEVNAIVGERKSVDYSVIKKFVSDEVFNSWFRKGHPKVGDVLFSTVGSIAEVAYVQEERGCIAQNLIALRPNEQFVIGEFLYYLLKERTVKAELLSLDISSVQPSIKVPHLLDKLIQLPPISEQRVIASILGSLDNKIELNRQMNEILDSMARAIFRDWFVDFGPIHARNEGREPYLSLDTWNLFPDKFQENGKPNGWEEKRIEDLLELAYGKALKSSERVEGSIPVYGSGGITGYHNIPLVNGPSVIVGRKGTVGSLYWEDNPFFPIDTVFFVKSKTKLTFCYYLLQCLGLDKMNTDAAVPGLNRNNVYRLLVELAPNEILQKFDEIVVPIRHKIKVNMDESLTLAGIRDLLLPKLMSGQISARNAELLLVPCNSYNFG